jgi:hypothetical protein
MRNSEIEGYLPEATCVLIDGEFVIQSTILTPSRSLKFLSYFISGGHNAVDVVGEQSNIGLFREIEGGFPVVQRVCKTETTG